MSVVSQLPEQRVVIDGVRWSTYVDLVRDGDIRRGRMTFDQGVLEMMSPGRIHENVGCLIGRMIETFTEELNIEIVNVASTTFKREDVQRGFEADEAYYIQNAHAVRSKGELDLLIDPPPDLVVEVDISRLSMKKDRLFSSLGVPEIWRYRGDQLSVLVRRDDDYITVDKSAALPTFPVAKVREVIQQRTSVGETTLIRGFRSWLQQRA